MNSLTQPIVNVQFQLAVELRNTRAHKSQMMK